MNDHRYPLEPLRRLSGLGRKQFIQRVGVGGKDYARYWSEGVSWKVADRIAGRCGFHPAEVWPEWYADAIAEHGRRCAECGTTFIPARRDGRFCQPQCYRRWWGREVKRRHRQTAAGAAANRARRRRYYAENADYERARERQRYQAKRAA